VVPGPLCGDPVPMTQTKAQQEEQELAESIVVDSDYDLNRKIGALDEGKQEALALPRVPGAKP
jgi:hypothetical protein